MLKWKIAAALGVAFGAAGVTWGYAQQSRAPGFYELRVYTALPGKRDALAERFAQRLFFQDHNEFANQAFPIAHGYESHSGLGDGKRGLGIRKPNDGQPASNPRDPAAPP